MATGTSGPYLVDRKDREKEVNEWDRNAVRAIPGLMAEAGFETYRLKQVR